jgi:cell division protein FtsB
MRNFILGFLCALAVGAAAVTVNQDGSETYTRDEVATIKANFVAMEAEIERLEGELDKANRFFAAILPKLKNCKPKETEL